MLVIQLTVTAPTTLTALLSSLPPHRGFHVCYIREDYAVPERIDPATGVVSTLLKPCHKFRMSFDARGPRDDIKVGRRMGE